MNVDELYRLGVWYANQFSGLNKRYNALLEPINHNANQPDKRPIEDQLNALIEFLSNQHFDELSLEQLKMLSSLGVDTYIGREGASYVDAAVRTSNYDPATAVQRFNTAIQSISSTRSLLSTYVEAVDNLGFAPSDVLAEDGLITIRVGFQNDVAINNIADWKETAKEWYDITRGLSMACRERPEDIKVIGAETGSVILILAGTAAFTALLAKISKHITSTAKDVIEIRMEMENLRQKKLLTKGMELELKKLEKERTDSAVATVEKLLDGKIENKDGDVGVALANSIKKLLTFSEKGGTVDFVSPEDDEDSDDEDVDPDSASLKAALIEAKAAIREYQGERESLKLLSDGTKTA